MSTALFPFNHNDLIIYFFHTITFFLTLVVVIVWRGWGQTGGSEPPAFHSLHSQFLPFFPFWLKSIDHFLLFLPLPSLLELTPSALSSCASYSSGFPHPLSSPIMVVVVAGGGGGIVGKAVWSTLGCPLAMPLLILSQNCTLHVPLIFFWH